MAAMAAAVIPYVVPGSWIRYDFHSIARDLVDACAAVQSLRALPFQRSWAKDLQEVQLKREVAGTSRIEGADFSDQELDQAMAGSPEKMATRSQRQAAATVRAYRWIAGLPADRELSAELILELHRLIVKDADDDHCEPGRLRGPSFNVTFGTPPHRGAAGGEECENAFRKLCAAFHREFRAHDALVQALAFHYHLAAIHPFGDGNGRTARALEAFLLQKTGLRDSLFIAMSNYYYDEKAAYLANLSEVRARGFDLTPFLSFGLKGIALQCRRLADAISTNLRKALYKNLVVDLFGRLSTPRKRVVAKRQVEILNLLLEAEHPAGALWRKVRYSYSALKDGDRAYYRDLAQLLEIGALDFRRENEKDLVLFVRLEWPTEITETEFFARVRRMPKAKSFPIVP